ncbi:MAG: replicative DNA helicase [Endomicrobium sp.]|jgi:replicative DNA helicase|nr:replicative DNA helicase [Endomicrobium sp.]
MKKNEQKILTVDVLRSPPPMSIDVENAVIGAMLIEKEAILKVINIIDESDFYDNKNRQIFLAICKLYLSSQAVDILTVSEFFKKNNIFENDGGVFGYLTNLINYVQTAANVESYAEIIRDKSILRKLITTGTMMIENSYKEQNSPEEILSESQTMLFSISRYNNRLDKGFLDVSKLVMPMLNNLEKLHSDPRKISGLSTGFSDFDSKTTGLHPSELIILASRPSMGKTAFALNIAEHVAVIKKKPVAIFSLEMKKESLMIRFLASLARVNATKLRNGQYNSADWPKLTTAAGKISESPIFIDDDSNMSILELKIRAIKLASDLRTKNEMLALIIIDYIQFINASSSKRFESRQQEVSDISRSLKALAKDLDVPVLVLSQLSRRTEDRGRKDNKPQLSDLRDSGAIEQDADVVAMLYREGYYNREDVEIQKKATLILGKQRNGPTGEINLIFEGEYMKFSDESRRCD